jgi:2-keto-myo-inositol isomerase
MISKEQFSLNRIMCPALSIRDFLEMTSDCGLGYIELRNDLGSGEIIDNHNPAEINSMCRDKGITIAAINAIQKFNLPSNFSKAEEEIKRTAELCVSINCKAIILCPNNDKNDKRTASQFTTDTAEALSKYSRIFKSAGITGLVEPLGFGECSIRGKKAAIAAISRSGEGHLYKFVHDTFHHYLGTDSDFYPAQTGLIHISGVEDDIPDSEMRDCHRVLVTEKDRIGNKEQITAMVNLGYKGIISFEPFSDRVQKLEIKQLKKAVDDSISFIING